MTFRNHLPSLTYIFLGAFTVLVSQYAGGQLGSQVETTDLSYSTSASTDGSFVQIVRLSSSLSEEDLVAKAKTRAEEFRALPGLIQKYYVKLPNEGDYAGIYIWDSKASFLEYKASDLAKTIGQAYEVTAPPSVELGDMLFLLRE